MTNAEIILANLDERLKAPAEITLYGRAAIQLGFPDPPPEYAQSLDVDAVLWLGQAEELLRGGDFWPAVEATNRTLAPQGLYLSHFFEENQLVLTPQWRQDRVPLEGPWRRLRLMRLGNRDLFLTKLMRCDPLDLADARFIIGRSGLTGADIGALIASARVPGIPEIQEQFALCSTKFS